MTNQEFDEFQTTVEGTAVSYENKEDGSTVVTCNDGVRLLVSVDGNSRILRAELESRHLSGSLSPAPASSQA